MLYQKDNNTNVIPFPKTVLVPAPWAHLSRLPQTQRRIERCNETVKRANIEQLVKIVRAARAADYHKNELTEACSAAGVTPSQSDWFLPELTIARVMFPNDRRRQRLFADAAAYLLETSHDDSDLRQRIHDLGGVQGCARLQRRRVRDNPLMKVLAPLLMKSGSTNIKVWRPNSNSISFSIYHGGREIRVENVR